ncbi:MAG: HAMP domain-containing histidine kinase [Phaeodactylibacter sp.]|nr:HAMP domain-containing histidine kinase [Phaeodactylibacter sp.]MCB9050416.1 HAMP domain-containing histidine kinase [Lewinellaceae bacterium]
MKKMIVFILALSLIGLGAVQYRFLVIGLKVAKAQFDQQARQALQLVNLELYEENEMSLLLASVVTSDPGNLRVSLDTLIDASESFFRDYLKGKLLSQGLDIDFAFAITDEPGTRSFLQSPDFQAINSVSSYRIPLEGAIPQRCGCRLLLHLKARNVVNYLLLQLNYLTIPFLIFFFLIVSGIIWLIRFLEVQSRLDEIKNDFINNLTHELKTPVFTIGLTANMLEKTLKQGREHQYLEVIQHEVEGLKLQINKVLELASLEKSRQVMEKKKLDVQDTLKPAIEHFQLNLARQDGTFSYNSEATRTTAFIDPVHLSNALQNLLDNAVKYSPEDKAIAVRTFNRENNFCIAVRDNGIGISPSAQKKIFEKFFRVSQADLHIAKGFGIGLSYVREVARLHGGKVEVESEPGKGSTFTLSIPTIE